jgi:hypothetical protein
MQANRCDLLFVKVWWGGEEGRGGEGRCEERRVVKSRAE